MYKMVRQRECCVKCADHVNVSLAVQTVPSSVIFVRTSLTLYNCTRHQTYGLPCHLSLLGRRAVYHSLYGSNGATDNRSSTLYDAAVDLPMWPSG